MNDPTMETLARRVERVERENRRLKQVGVVALAVVATVVLMGQLPQTPVGKVHKTIEAERFLLRDSTGKTVAAFGVRRDGLGRGLVILDKKGKRRVYVGTYKDNAGLFLSDTAERLRVALMIQPDGREALTFVNEAKKTRVILMIERDGKAALGMYDAAGKPRAGLVVMPDGKANLVLPEERGRANIRELLNLLFQLKAFGGVP